MTGIHVTILHGYHEISGYTLWPQSIELTLHMVGFAAHSITLQEIQFTQKIGLISSHKLSTTSKKSNPQWHKRNPKLGNFRHLKVFACKYRWLCCSCADSEGDGNIMSKSFCCGMKRALHSINNVQWCGGKSFVQPVWLKQGIQQSRLF